MNEIRGFASQREAVQQFEHLSNTELDEAFTTIENEFPEEVKILLSDYGLADSEIEQLRTDILNNKSIIKEKRILQNFVDLKNVYSDLGLLQIDSVMFTFGIYTRESEFGRTTGTEITTVQENLKSSWQNIDIQNPSRTEIENILNNASYLVEHGHIEYKDDFYAALVYLYLSIAGDDAFTQKLYNNSMKWTASQATEEDPTWQDTFNYAWTVRYQTLNDIQPEIVIEPEDPDKDLIIGPVPYLPLKSAGFRDSPCLMWHRLPKAKNSLLAPTPATAAMESAMVIEARGVTTAPKTVGTAMIQIPTAVMGHVTGTRTVGSVPRRLLQHQHQRVPQVRPRYRRMNVDVRMTLR